MCRYQPTSDKLARALGLRMQEMREIGSVDYLFDGADEVGKSLRMLKGRGGAMTREKTVAHASARASILCRRSNWLHVSVKPVLCQ
jgi:ribose 5-phosphate isomerase A